MREAATQRTDEERLQVEIAALAIDPLGYTMYAWDWANDATLHVVKMPEPWASRYDSEWGLDGWACEFMERLGELIRERGFDPTEPVTVAPIKAAVRSGHGIGKSAITGQLASFILDTRPGSRGVVTANTGTQLRTKTWPQIKKWKQKAITAHWWEIRELWIRSIYGEDAGQLDAVTNTKERSEAFAGQHEATASSIYLFDEASAIHDKIFEVAEGGLTDGEPFQFLFGNPTKNTGKLARAFKRERRRFDIAMEVDSRKAYLPNKNLIQQWIDDYGEDSDFVRVRVKGKEPRSSADQLIPLDVVTRAMRIETPHVDDDEPLVMGIDAARMGDDESVFAFRRGRDARSIAWAFHRELDGHQLGSRAAELCNHQATIGMPVAQIFCDVTGCGSSCYDHLLHLGYPVVPVNFGGNADRPDRFKDKAPEMWVRVREWMKEGGAVPDDEQLSGQLTGRPYDYTDSMKLYLMPKKICKLELDMGSPDRADALALTFAYPVNRIPRNTKELEHMHQVHQTINDL